MGLVNVMRWVRVMSNETGKKWVHFRVGCMVGFMSDSAAMVLIVSVVLFVCSGGVPFCKLAWLLSFSACVCTRTCFCRCFAGIYFGYLFSIWGGHVMEDNSMALSQ